MSRDSPTAENNHGESVQNEFTTQAQSNVTIPSTERPQDSSSVPPQVEFPPRVTSRSTASPLETLQLAASLIRPPVTPSAVELRRLQLEGLEGFDVHRIGTDLRPLLAVQCYRICHGLPERYLVLSDADGRDIPHSWVRGRALCRLAYFSDSNLLILKIPCILPETAQLLFGTRLQCKIGNMRMLDDLLLPCGNTVYRSDTSAKQADASFTPSCRNMARRRWPSLVFEAGFTDSLVRLRLEARWWLDNSYGAVRIVLVIALSPAQGILHIEKWGYAPLVADPGSLGAAQAEDEANETWVVTKLQEIRVFDSNGTVTGSPPLVLEFVDLFLRPAVLPEGDVIFTSEELLLMSRILWEGLQNNY